MALTNFTIDGTTVGTWARNVRLLKYMSGARRGRNFQIPYREGEYSNPVKWSSATQILLEVAFKRDDPAQHMSDFIKAVSPPASLVTLAGSNTAYGTVQCSVELMSEPSPHAQDPTVYIFQFRNPSGVWADATATTTTGDPPSVTTSGDRPIDDMVFTFASTGNVSHTLSGVTATLTLTTGASTGVVVDCGARTVVTSTGGAQDAYLTITQPYWMRWAPGSTQAISSTGLTKVVYRNKWAI